MSWNYMYMSCILMSVMLQLGHLFHYNEALKYAIKVIDASV